MSVPSHGPFCRTQTFDWQCPFCQSEIVRLEVHLWEPRVVQRWLAVMDSASLRRNS